VILSKGNVYGENGLPESKSVWEKKKYVSCLNEYEKNTGGKQGGMENFAVTDGGEEGQKKIVGRGKDQQRLGGEKTRGTLAQATGS